MKIIIEGCDGAGKSTLAKRLATSYGLVIEHDSVPQDFESYKQRLLDGNDVVYDRFFLGQFIYNKPEERKLTEDELDELIQICKDNNILLVYLDTFSIDIVTRYGNRSEQEKVKDQSIMERLGFTDFYEFISEVKKRYERILTHCHDVMLRVR